MGKTLLKAFITILVIAILIGIAIGYFLSSNQTSINSCSDSDGGKNYAKQGKTCIGGACFTDICNGNQLQEGICDGGLKVTESYACPAGYLCAGGSCQEGVSICGDNVCKTGYSCTNGRCNKEVINYNSCGDGICTPDEEVCRVGECIGCVPSATCPQDCPDADRACRGEDGQDTANTSNSDCCSLGEKVAGYQCIPDCGPPVLREDYTSTYRCLSPQEIEQGINCPVCLSINTKIATPSGEINVQDLKVGMLVWTVNKEGKKVAQPLLQVSSTVVPVDHKVVHLILSDGRELFVSLGHPTADGRTVGDLKAGDSYDGSLVVSTTLELYQGTKTYDLLPAGDTGQYWANGIMLGSTLRTTRNPSELLNTLFLFICHGRTTFLRR